MDNEATMRVRVSAPDGIVDSGEWPLSAVRDTLDKMKAADRRGHNKPPVKNTPEDEVVANRAYGIAAGELRQFIEQFEQLDAEKADIAERQSLAALEAKQRGAVAGDALGVFLIGVPVSSLTGSNVEGQIAASKGKALALEARLASCGGR